MKTTATATATAAATATVTVTAAAAAATAIGVFGAALVGPSASASKDPCTSSEVARTAGSVVMSIGDYLDAHPEANQAMTAVLQRPAGPESVAALQRYFSANPRAQSELAGLAEPLTTVTTMCRLPVGVPQVLALMQAAQGQPSRPGGQPGGLPGGPPGSAGTPSLPGPQQGAALPPPTVLR